MNDVDCILNALIAALKEAFAPDSEYPPLDGGTEHVRLFAGDGIPLAAWNAHAGGGDGDSEGCDHPFLWVRHVRRYRTQDFPNPFVGPAPCGLPSAVAIDVGVWTLRGAGDGAVLG